MVAPQSLAELARALRVSGVKVGTQAVLTATRALACIDLGRRGDVRDALRATLVTDSADFELFERLFALLYPERAAAPSTSSPQLPRSEDLPAAPGGRRIAAALPRPAIRPERAPHLLERDAQGSASDREILQRKDFAQMSRAELEAARALLYAAPPRHALRRTRRFAVASRGSALDLKRMSRAMQRGLDPLPLHRAPRLRPRDWVLLIDISGSMATYSRMALHLAHAVGRRGGSVETFVFATRLTRVTHALRRADPDAALQAATSAVADWDGGTRIGECLSEFNRVWARRVLGRAPWVILMSDGLERGSPAVLEIELARLARSCRELIWLNPLRRSAAYEPLAAGAAVMARIASRSLSAHDVHSLLSLTRLIERGRGAR